MGCIPYIERCVFSGEATDTNFIVFGLTRSGQKPKICRTGGEHANHAVLSDFQFRRSMYIVIYIKTLTLRKFNFRRKRTTTDTYSVFYFKHVVQIMV
jgi:hypothetical protein